MSYIFNESQLQFSFDQTIWNKVIQFDTHTDYKKLQKIGSLQDFDNKGNLISFCGTKAVDFLGIFNNEKIFFIEVKNFKEYRVSNKERLKNAGEILMTEIALKVKDSLSCIVGAKRNSTNDKVFWTKTVQFLSNEEKDIVIILWLETDDIINSNNVRGSNKIKRKVDTISDYQRKLQSKLRWLTKKRTNVKILNVKNYKNNLAFEVNYLLNNES